MYLKMDGNTSARYFQKQEGYKKGSWIKIFRKKKKKKSVSMFMGENLPQQEKQRSIEYIKNYFKKRKNTFQ